MRTSLFVLAGVMGMAGTALAQDGPWPVTLRKDFATPTVSATTLPSVEALLGQDQETERDRELRRARSEPRMHDREMFDLAIGPQVGYIRAKESDSGTWFVGVQGRMWIMEFIGLEAAVTFHKDEMFDGDVEVIQYPVQLSALISPFPGWDFRPYAIGGVGWYYTRTEFDEDRFPGQDDDTDNLFGVHVGGGVEADIGKNIGLNVDLRYIWINGTDFEDADDAVDDIDDRDFDNWQATAGLTIKF